MLTRMKRGYSRDAYDALVTHVRRVIPGVALSTDIIAGALLTARTSRLLPLVRMIPFCLGSKQQM